MKGLCRSACIRWLFGFTVAAMSLSAGAAEITSSPWVKLDVPYVPSPTPVVEAMLTVADVGEGDVLYDLGSGDGRIAIAAVRSRGAERAVGIDLNPLRVTEATANARAAGVSDRVTFIQGDIFKEDFSTASVVTMYLFDNVNLRLRPRILDELKPGTRIVSHQFHMFDWAPDKIVKAVDTIPVYFWIVPAKVAGTWKGEVGGKPFSLSLQQKFQTATGTVTTGNASGAVTAASLAGSKLRLEGRITRDGTDATVEFEGTAEGDRLTGTVSIGGARHDSVLAR